MKYGLYDGNLARGVQTGFNRPTFNGSFFYIGEMGQHGQLGRINFQEYWIWGMASIRANSTTRPI